MLHEQIKEKIKEALKVKDETLLLVLRGLVSAFTNELVATNRKPSDTLSDDEVLAVIKRQAKQRKDSIEQFKKGGRDDLAEKEQKELALLSEYLPQEMEKSEVEKVAKEIYQKLGSPDKSQMGTVMGVIMKELKGKADGALVKDIVDSLF